MPSEEERGKEEVERPRRAHLVDGKTHRKPAFPLESRDLNFSFDGAGVGQIYVSVCVCVRVDVWSCIWFVDVLNAEWVTPSIGVPQMATVGPKNSWLFFLHQAVPI